MLRTAMFVLLFATVAFAETPIEIYRADQPPTIDGILDDEIWKHATLVNDFLQRLPHEGAPASEKTEVRMAYTSTSLYIAFDAYDTKPDQMVATVMKRDDPDVVQNEQFAFAIDSYNDGRSGYWFSTNPLGARVDAQFANEGDLWEDNWNGWTVEIEIPFATLRFRNGPENIMGINLYRRIIRTNENLFAPLIPLRYLNGTPNVSIARKYKFIGIHGGDQLYVKPYALGGYSSDTISSASAKNAGADVRYQITNSLISNVSVRTDFSETEVDDRQINLTQFSLFFPEKRDFFLESSSNFQFGIPGQTEMFFSRRIGLSEDATQAVPMLVGGKLTGKVGGLDLGVLNVQTEATDLDPAENFSVVRLKQSIGPRSYFGGIFTNRSGNGDANQTYGLDLNQYLFHEIFFNAFASELTNHASAFSAALQRESERTSFLLAYRDIAKDFDPAIGFIQKTDIKRIEGNLFVPFYWNQSWLQSITPGYEIQNDDDHEGSLSSRFQQLSLNVAAVSGDAIKFFANEDHEFVPEAFPVFRSYFVPVGDYTFQRAGLSMTTKPGRILSASIQASSGGFFGGTRTELSPSIVWKANRHFTISESYFNDWIELDGSSFRIQLTRTRIGYSLNTQFSLSSILQYDNDSRKLGFNLRASYLFREGTEILFAYDELRNQQRSFVVKFTYLFGI
jgi:hypothetical protein